MGQPSDELIERIWSTLYEKQESINRQVEESEKKFFQREQENRLLQERIEKKYFERLEESRLLMEQTEKKYFDKLEEKERQLEEIWQKIFAKLEENRLLKEELEAEEKKSGKTKKFKKFPNYQIELADHPVYSAILRLLAERGYNIDSDTLQSYWEMIALITRPADSQDD